MDIDRAGKFCHSYGEAMARSDSAGLVGHYGFPYISFTNGYITSFDSVEQANAAVASHVERFDTTGLGSDIRLTDYRVEAASPTSALCHLTWEIFPANATPGWAWTNIYGLRQGPDSQHFEFNISDNEIGELLGRFPDFMSPITAG